MTGRFSVKTGIVLGIALAPLLGSALTGCKSKDITLKEEENPPVQRDEPQTHSVTGTVSYRLRIALPPEAVVNVRLEDLSLADAKSRPIAGARIVTEGRQAPIPFTLSYDADQIQQSHRYSVSATIDIGDITLFASTQEHPVLTQGGGNRVDIEVEQAEAGASKPPPTEPAAAPLEGTRWALIELNGQPIIDVPGVRAVAIAFEKKDNVINGSTGVNNFSGGWSLIDDRLTVNPGAMTMMAGPEPLMMQEQAYIRALKGVTSYRIAGTTLELLDGNTVIAKFEARKDG